VKIAWRANGANRIVVVVVADHHAARIVVVADAASYRIVVVDVASTTAMNQASVAFSQRTGFNG
jgi:hypothetical protein